MHAPSFLSFLSCRLLIIRKRPTLLKLCCAGAVLIGLLASLIPIMSGDNSDPQDKQAWLQQPIAARVLWPLCFMFGFVCLLSNSMAGCVAKSLFLASVIISGTSCINECVSGERAQGQQESELAVLPLLD